MTHNEILIYNTTIGSIEQKFLANNSIIWPSLGIIKDHLFYKLKDSHDV